MIRRLHEFTQLDFLLDNAIGFIGGPTYLLLHLQPGIQDSSGWAEKGAGANIGFALMAMFVHFLVTYFSKNLQYLVHATVFSFVLLLATKTLHVVRSTEEDKLMWRYAVHGFILGCMFSVFGLWFRRCFLNCVVVSRR